MLNVSGHRMSTAEIESAIVSHPKVAEAAVIGQSDEDTGQSVCAFVTLEGDLEGTDELVEEIREHVAKRIGKLARPKRIIWSDDLPKTRSGKIMRRLLRDIAEGRELGDVTTLRDPDVMAQLEEQDQGAPGGRRLMPAALVTGAAGGIGGAITQRLCDEGWDVLAVDLKPAADGPGVAFEADLTTRAGNADAVAAAIERFGGLDALVPNAGVQHVAPVEEFPEDKWDLLVASCSPARSCSRAPRGRPCARASRGASSRSPPPTRSPPRPTSRPTCRPSTACSGS